MTINARTYQILYIIRQRALSGLPTTMPEILDFIAERRKTAPETYYIAPSDLSKILERMSSENTLLIKSHTHPTQYQFSPRGSHMADLIDGIDACSKTFIEFYKGAVCLAVIQQNRRLGKSNLAAGEIATLANISRDSARKGLVDLLASNQITSMYQRNMTVYDLVSPPTPIQKDTQDETEEEAKKSTQDPVVAEDPSCTIREILATIKRTDSQASLPETADIQFSLKESAEGFEELSLSQILSDDEGDNDGDADSLPPPPPQPPAVGVEVEVEVDRYVWEDVPEKVRNQHIQRAKASGMTLAGYLGLLNRSLATQTRQMMRGDYPALEQLVRQVQRLVRG